MNYIKGLAKRKLNNWVGKEWYHQRFDGSPYFMHFIGEGEISHHKERKYGGYFTVHYCFYDKGKADWYILIDDIKQVYTSIIKESKKIPHISKYFIGLWKEDQEKFYNKCNEVGKIDLKKLSDKELAKLHDDFVNITISKNSSSSLIDGFALGTDELIAQRIKKAYEKANIKQRFTEVFSILTAPSHLSFINEAEVSLLKVALIYDFDTPTKDAINALKEHQKNYFWINNNYVSSYILDTKYFIEEIKRLQNIDILSELKKIENAPLENKRKKENMMRNIDLDDELKTLIEISEDFTYWQDERKKSTLWTTHYFSLILEEVSKRVDMPIENLKYMTPREVSIIFENKPEIEELEARKNNGVYYWDQEGLEALHSEDANEVKEKILGTKKLDDVDDFRGLTACTGKAVGKVKILKSATEVNKIEKGDILVAVMTRPDYVSAMKKAAAIVTDEGGITSHASIVSRELGIPCIIGTKIATKVLKDGQEVEVNANHGWVKIISKT